MAANGAGHSPVRGRPSVETASLDGREWSEFASAHPAGTVFHQPAWLAVVSRAFGYRHASLLARRDGVVTGFLPLFVVPGLPWGRALVSTPLAVYGGVIAADPESAAALFEGAGALADRLRARYLELRHERPPEGLPPLPSKDLYVTFRRAILPTADENMAAVPRNQRRSIRVAQKHGLVATIGREELLGAFYDVYSQSVRNLGTPVFPRRLFAAALERFPDARILAVRREGTTLSAVLTLYHRDAVMPYYGGATREGIRYATNDFMYWSLLLDGMERGYRVFDFGRSKRGTGSYDFKRHWGFEPTPLAYQYRMAPGRAMPDLSPRNPRFSLAIRIWQRLPLRITQWIGPSIVRYFP